MLISPMRPAANAARALIAAFLRVGQLQVVAQRIEQRRARFERETVFPAVDRENHWDGTRPSNDGRVKRRGVRGREDVTAVQADCQQR